MASISKISSASSKVGTIFIDSEKSSEFKYEHTIKFFFLFVRLYPKIIKNLCYPC